MSFGLEIEISNVRLKEHVRIERSEKGHRLSFAPFPFSEIIVKGNKFIGRLLTRFSSLDGVTPNLNAILRAIETFSEYDTLNLKIGTFYELQIDKRRGIVTAIGLADMRRKVFKLSDIQKLELGKIWRKIYEF